MLVPPRQTYFDHNSPAKHYVSKGRQESSVKTPSGDAVIEGSQHSWLDLFTPKLLTVLKEGYGLQQFRADATAGLTVAIVALPLSMAIAIASGVSPAQGLYTAIVGGFLVSALGGSRFQIGGPAGAFIVLVGTTVQVHGVDGLILATIISGMILVLAGVFCNSALMSNSFPIP